jgi:hypothetical protein
LVVGCNKHQLARGEPWIGALSGNKEQEERQQAGAGRRRAVGRRVEKVRASVSLRHAQQQQDPVGHQQQQKLREQHTVAATYVYLPIQAVGMYYMHDA